jgi:hypothetical protein
VSSVTARYHLGVGALSLERDISVFINCPFDEDFKYVFDAIVFAAICCGFLPRCAIESGTASESRMGRIVRAISSSKYSIHDLLRCKGEGETNLARFNMPLELGIAMAERFRDSSNGSSHDWLLLVPRGHVYKRFLSDLAGYDPTEYDGSAETVVPAVMSWLATRPDAVSCATPQAVLGVLPAFRAEREALCARWCGREPWPDVLMMAMRIGREAELILYNAG